MAELKFKKIALRARRHNRIRGRVVGSVSRPRLSVFRSSKHTYAQLIDDATGKTLASASTREVKSSGKKAELSAELGKLIAGKAKEKGIAACVFDRGGYRYHGRVKALAEAAREAGLTI